LRNNSASVGYAIGHETSRKHFTTNFVLVGLCTFLSLYTAQAQGPEITGFSSDGTLTFNSVTVGNSYTLEFAASPQGVWTNWGSVSSQQITNQVMSLPTPVFFRIRETRPGVVSDPALQNYLCMHGFDHNHDCKISSNEAAAVTSLFLHGTGFVELDCTPFDNLERAAITYNTPLTNLHIAANSDLTYLACERSGLRSLNTSENTNLVTLSIRNNLLTSVDLSSNIALDTLNIDNNMITNVDISANTNLTWIDLRENPTEQVVVWWNISNAPPLTILYDGSPEFRNP
jgi:hypothetical protein